MDSEAIVLAGGLGTRLRTVLENIPKPLAPIQGRPFLGYLMDYLSQQGIRRVILSLGYKAEAILSYIQQISWEIEIFPVVEPSPLGTGGALAYAWKYISSPHVFFLNGDTFFPVPLKAFLEFHTGEGVPVSVALAYVSPADRYGLVEVAEGRVKAFREKAPASEGWIYGGIALVEAIWWEQQSWPETFSWEAYLSQAVPALPVGAFQPEGIPFIDIGVPKDYERAQTLIPRYARF